MPAGLELQQVEGREACPDQCHVGFVLAKKRVPVTLAVLEGQVLFVDLRAIHGFAAPVHGHLHRRAQVVQGILTPIKVDRQVADHTALLDQPYGPRRVASPDTWRDTDAGEVRQRPDSQEEGRAKGPYREPDR